MEALLDPVWEECDFLVKWAKGMIPLQGGAPDPSAGAPPGKSIPPLQVPSPFSGFGPVMGGGAGGFGNAGDGNAPLFAAIFCCLFALLPWDRSRVRRAFLWPGMIPRLALERPG
jgi:hypothetical protein